VVAHNKELVGCIDHLILLEQLYVWGNFQLTWYQKLLWETFLQQACFKNGEVDGRIALRYIVGKYVIGGAR